jgi:hypothetical protein
MNTFPYARDQINRPQSTESEPQCARLQSRPPPRHSGLRKRVRILHIRIPMPYP